MTEETKSPGILIENLTKNYEDLVAVNNLNLSIPRGEFFSFLGPNGAGKTTTIKILTGLVRPSSGRTLVAGYDVQQNPVEAKRRIGYIPDHPYLYEKLSGRDFFRFVGDLFGVPRDQQDEKLEYFFKMFSLLSAADKLIENYSHGMRQKLVISASLMHDPEIIIVDEPMVGLDPQSARIVKDLFHLQVEMGRTIFLSTHVLSITEELADRIGIINRGKLQFLGTIEELRVHQKRDANLEELFLDLTQSVAAEP
ncbi:MAG: ABC transporter ATP-binding protein [Candidatus Sumerlaeaceae bacterium]|nr:ABC transporter ATP-binding protein [Candidatus Sumerlaeaceae bacterium]